MQSLRRSCDTCWLCHTPTCCFVPPNREDALYVDPQHWGKGLGAAWSRRDYGKPRPALILRADAFDAHPSVTVLPLTQEIHPTPLFRVTVQPGKETGLRRVSQVMVDKATTVPQAKIGARMGRLDAATMQAISRAVLGFLGL